MIVDLFVLRRVKGPMNFSGHHEHKLRARPAMGWVCEGLVGVCVGPQVFNISYIVLFSTLKIHEYLK